MSAFPELESCANARPGYSLAAFREAALPMYQLTARVLTLETRPLNPIEEGYLRAVSAGLTDPVEIEDFLGLPNLVLTSVLAGLNTQEFITYFRPAAAQPARVAITGKGEAALSEASQTQPRERIVKLVFDPLIKRVVFEDPRSLARPKEVKALGLAEIPLCGAKRPEIGDVPLEEIDKALERIRRQEEVRSELLALRKIERRELLFVPCLVLFYRSKSSSEVQVAFLRDGRFLLDHEAAFRELDGPRQIGATLVADTPAIDLPGGIDLPAEMVLVTDLPEAVAAEGVESPTLQIIRCHDHPKLLWEALRNSQSRLLIISPWITEKVVDHDFLKALRELLARKCKVHIGYGIDNDPRGDGKKGKGKAIIAPTVLEAFEKLQKQFPSFDLTLIGNTHRKFLVSDSKFAVATSFNWLSFRGDRKMHARDESGVLLNKRKYVDACFDDAMSLIRQGYDHPA